MGWGGGQGCCLVETAVTTLTCYVNRTAVTTCPPFPRLLLAAYSVVKGDYSVGIKWFLYGNADME